MSALAEALVAAQRRAIAAIEKGVVSGTFAADAAMEALDSIGAVCACDDAFVCSRCQDTPDDPAYLDAEREPEYEPHAADASVNE